MNNPSRQAARSSRLPQGDARVVGAPIGPATIIPGPTRGAGTALHDQVARTNAPVISRSASLIDGAVTPFVRPGGAYALLDFPDYPNVGDSLIWLGASTYLGHKTGRPPSYVCTTYNLDMDELERCLPTGPIFLSGGGNFGDIYPRFQEFRIKLLNRFRGRPIIQLPQTLSFRADRALAETRSAIATHGDFTLLVRDEASLSLARANFDCRSGLCPDMAFCLGPLARPVAPSIDVIYLLRTDAETMSERGTAPPAPHLSAVTCDWLQEPADPLRDLARRILGRLDRSAGFPPRHIVYRRRAQWQLERGARMLSAGGLVVTDRLHGHILSVLLGIEHAALDNSYGKISGFAKLWTLPGAAGTLARDLGEATRWVQTKLQSSVGAPPDNRDDRIVLKRTGEA